MRTSTRSSPAWSVQPIADEYVGAVNKAMQQNTCDNCQNAFDPSKEGLVTLYVNRHAAAVCGGCLAGSKKIKLVLRRGDLGGFTYDQYQAIETFRTAG